MRKIVGKIKKSVSGISWPKPKEIVSDTFFVIAVTAVLSTLIFLWTSGIELIVDFVISLF